MKAASNIKGKVGRVDGWENCKVGAGARTIAPSPSGNYIFAACNVDSKLCVVDTRTMKLVASIAIDSYPVGLDVSSDGKCLILTSQGRRNMGGNAVNLVKVDYAEPEPVINDAYGAALLQDIEKDNSAPEVASENGIIKAGSNQSLPYLLAGGAAVLMGAAYLIFRRRRLPESGK